MKARLPKALLLAVLACYTASATEIPTFTHQEPDKNGNMVDVTRYGKVLSQTGNTVYTDWHEGGYQVYKNHIIGTGNSYEEDLAILEKEISGNSAKKPMPVVKDGENSTFTVTKNVAITNPLVVREGTLRFEGTGESKLNATVNVGDINSYMNLISVGGKNATLELDNASFSPAGAEQPSIVIGTADGAGTIKLTNGSVISNNHYIMAGDHDGQRMTQTGWSPDTSNAVYNALGTGHVKGTYNYDAEYNGTHSATVPVAYGNQNTTGEQSKIEILSGSQMIAGSSLQLGHVDVTIDGKDSVLTDKGARTGSPTVNDNASYLGHETSSTQDIETNINITNGGTFESNWNLITGGKHREDAGASKVNITVGSETENATSTFKVDGHFEMGGNHSSASGASDKSSTTLTVNAGGEALLNVVSVGDKGTGSIVVNKGGRIGTVSADERVYSHGDQSAVPSDSPLIIVNEKGTLTNAGEIKMDIKLDGGKVTNSGTFSTDKVTIAKGTMTNTGTVTVHNLEMTGTGNATRSTESFTGAFVNENTLTVKGDAIITDSAFTNKNGSSLFRGANNTITNSAILNQKGNTKFLGSVDSKASTFEVKNGQIYFDSTSATVRADNASQFITNKTTSSDNPVIRFGNQYGGKDFKLISDGASFTANGGTYYFHGAIQANQGTTIATKNGGNMYFEGQAELTGTTVNRPEASAGTMIFHNDVILKGGNKFTSPSGSISFSKSVTAEGNNEFVGGVSIKNMVVNGGTQTFTQIKNNTAIATQPISFTDVSIADGSDGRIDIITSQPGSLSFSGDCEVTTLTYAASSMEVKGNLVVTEALTLKGRESFFSSNGQLISLGLEPVVFVVSDISEIPTLTFNGSADKLDIADGQTFELVFAKTAVEQLVNAGPDVSLTLNLLQGEAFKDMEISVDIYTESKDYDAKALFGTESVTFSGANSQTLTTIPEPTTATLSLLALVGLAARRRRK